VRAQDIHAGQNDEQVPRLVVTFYDENRAPIGFGELGPWTGTFDWSEKSARLKVPREAKLAVVIVGLLGATGELSIDGVQVRAARANTSALTP
jgi:protein-L-isoaspartate(D-aspartate) O-methyltransferase